MKHKLLDLERSSDDIYQNFNRTQRVLDDSGILFDDDTPESKDLTTDDEFDVSDSDGNDDGPIDAVNGVHNDVDVISSNRTVYPGLRLVDEVNPSCKSSYFEIRVNEQNRYLHKQSAVWLLTDQKNHLSSERLLRVIQTSKDENKLN